METQRRYGGAWVNERRPEPRILVVPSAPITRNLGPRLARGESAIAESARRWRLSAKFSTAPVPPHAAARNTSRAGPRRA